MTPEAKVKAKVKQILKDHGAYFFMPATGGYGRSGVPDIIALYKGVFIGIECKANGNTATELQKIQLNKIRDSGGKALVIDENNIGDLSTLLLYLQDE